MKPAQTPPPAEIVVHVADVPVIDAPPTLPPDRNPYLVYLGRFDKKTSRETMMHALRAVASVLADSDEGEVDPSAVKWWGLRYQHVERIKAELMDRYKPASVNKMMAGLRQVLHCCRKLELMTADACAAATDVKNIKFDLLPAGRTAPDDDVRTILRSMPSATLAELRDRAIFATLYFSGIRRSEASTMTMSRLQRDGWMRVLGKGNKERMVPILDDLSDYLSPWVGARGNEPGALFCSVANNQIDAGHAISPQYVYDVIIDASSRSPFGYALSPHDLRRSFITNGIDMGIDPLTMSKIVGHEQLQTTLRYDRRGEKTQREQMVKAFGKKRST